MLLSEIRLRNAVKKFLAEAKLPSLGNSKMEKLYIEHVITPAFLDALREIEQVDLSYGFDVKHVWKEGEDD